MPKPTAAPRAPSPASIRKKLGLNQSQFWNPLGCTQSAGSRYEGGRAMPKPVQILYRLRYGTPKERATTLLEFTAVKGKV